MTGRRGAEIRHMRTGEVGAKFQQKATVVPGDEICLFREDSNEAEVFVTPTE